MANLKEIPDAVIASITRAFPDQAQEILESIQRDGISQCYYFLRWGLYVGVEDDGYIHT